MKKSFPVLIVTSLLFAAACVREPVEPPKERDAPALSRAVPTPWFDWENADWMPTPAGQSRIPSPWMGAGSLLPTYGLDIVNDRKAADGWELVYNTFDASAPGPLANPYFLLYNKYRGILRAFFYMTTPFYSSSSYLKTKLQVTSTTPTSMLNFLGDDLVDATKNRMEYVSVLPKMGSSPPLATNKWYMAQFEMAYDPNIADIPYNQIALSWALDSYDAHTIKLNGKVQGKLTGTVGVTSEPNISGSVGNLARVAGGGVVAGLGQKFLENSTSTPTKDNPANNTLGLSNNTFNSLVSGIGGAVSAAASGLPGAIVNVMSSIIGGSSGGPTPISMTLSADIEMEGTITNGGSFPGSPISFYVPGTEISSTAPGYIPLYDKPFGVVNFIGKPDIRVRELKTCYEADDQNGGTPIPYWGEFYERYFPSTTDCSQDPYCWHFAHHYPMMVTRIPSDYFNYIIERYHPPVADYSPHLVINPEVLAIANVDIVAQDIVLVWDSRAVTVNPVYGHYDSLGATCSYDYGHSWGFHEIGVRFTIKVTPHNGAPVSWIVKTFKLNAIIDEIDYYEDWWGNWGNWGRTY